MSTKESDERQLLTDVMRKQSSLLEKIQRIAQIGGWELDLRTNALTWTEETYRIHGTSPTTFTPTVEAAIGFYTRASQPIIRRALETAVNLAIQFDLELPILTSGGNLRWVRSIGRRADPEGEPHIVCGVVQDVTERRLLEEEILSIAQREQARIGSDLHDGLGQELTGMSLVLHSVVSKLTPTAAPIRDILIDLQQQVRAAIHTCRTLAQGLSPTARTRGGLVVALQELACLLEERHTLPVSVRMRGPNVPIEEAVADHLYRITQEALTNALKHANPTRITIDFYVTAQNIVISVTNDANAHPKNMIDGAGMGLYIMRYRARLIGGMLVLRRLPTGGMRVRCCVPLHR